MLSLDGFPSNGSLGFVSLRLLFVFFKELALNIKKTLKTYVFKIYLSYVHFDISRNELWCIWMFLYCPRNKLVIALIYLN